MTHRIEVLQEVYRLKGNIKVEKHSEKKQKKDKKDDKDQKDTHLKVMSHFIWTVVNCWQAMWCMCLNSNLKSLFRMSIGLVVVEN